MSRLLPNQLSSLIKKIKFSSYIRKFRMKQLQSHLWLTASSYCLRLNICAYPHIVYVLGSPSSYMTFFSISFPAIIQNLSILINKEHRYSLGMRWACTSYSRRSSHPSRVHTCTHVSRAGIFERVWGPGIDSKEWIPPAYVAWRAGTITLFLLGA